MDESDFRKIERLIVRRLKRYSYYVDEPLLKKAFVFAEESHKDQLRKSGEPYYSHPLLVAKLLTEFKMDYNTVVGGLLHDVVEDTGVTLAEVADEFGDEIALLVDGVTKISELKFESIEMRKAENFRKMILSMVKDIRVILIKFADRLHNMTTLGHLAESKQRRIASETREVYAPLAHRLGMAKVKAELEDLCMKILEPEAYQELVKKLDEKKQDRESYIQEFTEPLSKALKEASIRARMTGRSKHFYSIYQKLKTRSKAFEEIYDLIGIRILVKKVEECYYVLGLVHNLFTPVQERFKDYVATPKSNMYQSLHTTVVGPRGRMVEVQIRTDEMHRTAEEGIAAHWRYKQGKDGARDEEIDKHFAWLRQILEWQQETNDPNEFLENLRIDLFQDEVFVFTPQGDLFKLPLGSTPVDFAFSVHTDVGMHCIGAKVNGKIVPLDYKLQSGDSVEIITSASQKPNPEWLTFICTSKARSRIRKWQRDSFYEQSQKLGEEILHKQFKRRHIKKSGEELKEIAHTFGHNDLGQFYAEIGRGEISIQSILRKISPQEEETPGDDSFLKKFISRARGAANGVRVQGLDNLLINFAKCCQPVPGDNILGFISRGRGVIVHRANCKNIEKLLETPEKCINVEWDVEKDKHFIVRIHLIGEDRKDFLRDITEKISLTRTNIVSLNTKTQDTLVTTNLIIEVRNLQHLNKVIHNIGKVNGVIGVERLNGTANF